MGKGDSDELDELAEALRSAGLAEGSLEMSHGPRRHLSPPTDFWGPLVSLEHAREHGKAVHASGMFLYDAGVIGSQQHRAVRPWQVTPEDVDDFRVVTDETSPDLGLPPILECLPSDGWRLCPVWTTPEQLDALAMGLFYREACRQEGKPTNGTSLSHPIYVDWVGFGASRGALGITLAPGMRVLGHWSRDLTDDLRRLQGRLGVTELVSALPRDERAVLGMRGLFNVGRSIDSPLSILDFPLAMDAAPSRNELRAMAVKISASIEAGAWVAINSRNGLGRAAMLAAVGLMQSGLVKTPREATQRVRCARPGALNSNSEVQCACIATQAERPPVGTKVLLADAQRFPPAVHKSDQWRVIVDYDGEVALQTIHCGGYYGARVDLYWTEPGKGETPPDDGWTLVDDPGPGMEEMDAYEHEKD